MNENEQKPHNLPLSLTISLILTAIIGFQVFKINTSAPKAQGLDLTLDNILTQVNNERALRNLPTLNTDTRLSKAAQSKSDDMQTRHYFSHTDPEGNYIWNKIVGEGYSPYLTLGENLAIDFFNTESLVSAWMNSPTHRANILNQSFKDQGMGLTMGRANTNDYYSAIANTFGALLQKKALASETKPETTTTPTTTKKTASTKTESVKKVTTLPPPSKSSPLNVRNASITEPHLTVTETTTPVSEVEKLLSNSKPVIPKEKSWYEKNRWLNLSWAGILFIFLVLDIKLLQKNRWLNADKKINNLVLLILAVILTALLYWI